MTALPVIAIAHLDVSQFRPSSRGSSCSSAKASKFIEPRFCCIVISRNIPGPDTMRAKAHEPMTVHARFRRAHRLRHGQLSKRSIGIPKSHIARLTDSDKAITADIVANRVASRRCSLVRIVSVISASVAASGGARDLCAHHISDAHS